MNIQINKNRNTTVSMSDDKVTINGVEYDKPSRGSNMTIVNQTVYINGYVFKYGRFRRSLIAI